jgi:hypothetical protein
VSAFTPALVRRVAIGLVVVAMLAAMVLIAPRVVRTLADRVALEATTTTAPSVPTTVTTTATTLVTPVETTVLAPSGGVFDVPATEFVRRWEEVGLAVSPLFDISQPLATGDFEAGFSEGVGMQGSVGEDGRVSSYTVVVDPSTEDDWLGVNAFGVALRVADPTMSGTDLRARLAELGLDLEQTPLQLEGIDGRVVDGGMVYRLLYDSERVLLRLTIEPAET